MGCPDDEPQHERRSVRQEVGQEEEVQQEQDPFQGRPQRSENCRKRNREGTVHPGII